MILLMRLISRAHHELYSEGDEGVYFCEMGNAQKLAELIKEIKDKSEL